MSEIQNHNEYQWQGLVTNIADEIALYDFLRRRLKWSRRFLRRLRENGHVKINGETVPYFNVGLKMNDQIEVTWIEAVVPSNEFLDSAAIEVPELQILQMDHDLIVINKPSGYLVHPVRFYRGKTIQEALIARLGGEMVQPVHRLDRETSGVLLFARHAMAQQHLSEQFKHKTVLKKYIAIGLGWSEQDEMIVDLPIGVDPDHPCQRLIDENGQSSTSIFTVLQRSYWGDQPVTMFKVVPQTGRTHQIRVHAQAIGHPLVGDFVYGGDRCRALSDRVCLHANSLRVKHPSTGHEIEWETDMPSEWQMTMKD